MSGACVVAGDMLDASGSSDCKISGYKASCGGNTDPTCYTGTAPNISTLCRAPPQLQDTCTPNGGSCTTQSFCNVEGGTRGIGTCNGGGYCCKFPKTPEQECRDIGGSCVDADSCFEGATGSTSLMCGAGKTCCKTVKSGEYVCIPPGQTVPNGCVRAPERQLDCGEDAAMYNCPSGSRIGGPTTAAPTCGAPYSGSCTAADATRTAATPERPACTTSSGVTGKSVKVCQKIGSIHCWYDQYSDTNKSRAERDAGCYPNPVTGGPVTDTCTAANGTCQFKTVQECNTAITPNRDCELLSNVTCTNGNPCTRSKAPVVSTCLGQNLQCVLKGTCGGAPFNGQVTSNTTCGASQECCNTTSGLAATGTQITFNLGLSGLGNTGDSQNFSNASGSTKEEKLKRKSRKLFYQIFDQNVNLVAEGDGTVEYNSSSGTFTRNSLGLGKTLTNGTYIVKARVLGYKTRIVRNVNIGPGGATITANLPTGDIDGNLEVNTLDYDILRSCWGAGGTDPAKCNSNASFRGMSDLDDNGTINEFDYNLFLRDFSAAQREE